MAEYLNCKWCGRRYKINTLGSTAKFCSAKCDKEYWENKNRIMENKIGKLENKYPENRTSGSSKSTSSPDGCGKIVAWSILILIIWAILQANGVL